MNLSGLNVLITGGGSGIGLAFAAALLREGNRVIVCGRDEKKLIAAQHAYPGLKIFPCDISSIHDVDNLYKEVKEQYGNLDILINNAGIQRSLDLLEGCDHWNDVAEEVSINLTSQIQLTLRLLPILSPQGSAIINVTSALAVVPKKSSPVYCATKAGLHNFTQSLRYQLGTSEIKVFEVVPALVDTEMTQGRPSRAKISSKRLVDEALRGIQRNRETIYIERTRLLMAIYRICPRIAYRLLRDQ